MICQECKQEWTLCNSESCDECGADRHICSEDHIAACVDCPSVRNEWQMQCPQCGSDEAIHISATQRVEVRLCVGGTDSEGGDTEWEDDDAAWCTDCGFQGVVKDFQLKEDGGHEREPEPTKSEIVEAWAKENNVEVVKLAPAETTPVDLSGLPKKKEEQ